MNRDELEKKVLVKLASQGLGKVIDRGSVKKPDGVYRYEVTENVDSAIGVSVWSPEGEQYEDQGGAPGSPKSKADAVSSAKKRIDAISAKANQ